MNFTSVTFLFIFLPIFLALYYLISNIFLKNIFLLIVSIMFYATCEPMFVFIMVLSIIFNYFIAKVIHSSKSKYIKRKYLICAIVVNFGIMAIFKYTNFVINTINILPFINIKNTNLPLPVGISFFTFQAVSYVLDIYFDENNQRTDYYKDNIINFALYISMFPQLVAGPIVRYSDIVKEIHSRKFDIESINIGIKRFIYGLSKKVLIANSMAIVADRAFLLDPHDAGSSLLILGAISYTLQIYFDFSGYSDMAIGIGKMLGFTFPENFNYPYKATSITDFWKRWHITLSSWFKDYLYIPLGGSKRNYKKTITNLFIVWSLTGLWHGANWTFVFWGILYFIFLVFEKKFKMKYKQNIDDVLPYMLCRIYTIVVVTFIWIFFRSDSIKDAFIYIINIFNFTNRGLVNGQALYFIKEYLLFYIIAILSSLKVFANFKDVFITDKENKIYVIFSNIFPAILLVICTIYIVKGSFNPFIYFNF